MASSPYDDILKRAETELDLAEQLKLIDAISQRAGRRNGPRRITELEGLGSERWKGIDADEYVRKERDSWSG